LPEKRNNRAGRFSFKAAGGDVITGFIFFK